MLRFSCLCLLVGISPISRSYAQEPTALAKAVADLTGDGVDDSIVLDSQGVLRVFSAGKNEAVIAQAFEDKQLREATVTVDTRHTPAIILASAAHGTTPPKRQVAAFQWTDNALSLIWQGQTGPVGPAGETSVSVELGDFGLIKYISRPGVFRCDGAKAHLFAERFDAATGRFRPARQAMRIPTTAPTLVTQNDPPLGIAPDATGMWFFARGASSALRANSPEELVAPVQLTDGDDKTAWVENKGGVGTGEFVTLVSEIGEVPIRAIRLHLGHGAAPKAFLRPKRLGLLLDSNQAFWLDVPQDPKSTPQWIHLPTDTKAKCVTLLLHETFPGGSPKVHGNRTAISEVSIVSTSGGEGYADVLAERIARQNLRPSTAVLKRMGPPLAPALVAAIHKHSDARAKRRLRLTLARIPAAPEELAKGLGDDDATAKEHAAFLGALLRLDKPAIDAIGKALPKALSFGASERMAKTLLRFSDAKARQSVVARLGLGNRDQRRAIAHALSDDVGWTPELDELLGPTQTPTFRADAMFALSRSMSRQEEGTQQAFQAHLERALMQKPTYEERTRILQALALLGTPEAVRLLARHLQTLQDRSAASDALRVVAIRALSGNVNEGANAVRKSFSKHDDPGTRLAVLASFDSNATMPELQTELLLRDRWPEVRRAASASLQGACQPIVIEALRTSILTDESAQVARTSLTGLLSCTTKQELPFLADLVQHDERPLELRLLAARTLGLRVTPDFVPTLLKLFDHARRKSLTSAKSAKLAAALTAGLARAATTGAIERLTSAALDPASPVLQAAAILALGKICPKGFATDLAALAADTSPQIQRAIRTTQKRCQRKLTE